VADRRARANTFQPLRAISGRLLAVDECEKERSMSETLLQFPASVMGPDGNEYEARACGGPLSGGTWQGWIEFIPIAKGDPLRSRRETTQPIRTDTIYWASGLTPVYLEGSLRRALAAPTA